MKYRAWLFLVTGTLAGCGTTWHNANISDPSILARQLAIDEGYCTSVAAGAAPMPEIRLYTPPQQGYGYTVSGSATTLGPNGLQTSFYSGTITPTNNFGSGFSSGLAQGAALGATIRARQERDAVMKGCMFNLGWSDTTKPTTEKADNQQTFPTSPPSTASAAWSQENKEASMPKREHPTNLSCDQWTDDVAIVVDSAWATGVPREDVAYAGRDYLSKVSASSQERLIFAHILNTRYRVPSAELSSENFPRYVHWECEQGWSHIGLGNAS